MFRRLGTILLVFLTASGILAVSVFRSASVRYAFSQSPSPSPGVIKAEDVEVDYELPYPGRILPDHPLWPLKALRDRLWLMVVTNPTKKAEIKLLFADKRVTAARILFERDKSELGLSTLTKAEKYLEEAFDQGKLAQAKKAEMGTFFENLAMSALKHRQVIEDIIILSPEDAKPTVIKTRDYPERIFDETRGVLGEMGKEAPQNPFED